MRTPWFTYSDRNCNTYVDTYCNADTYCNNNTEIYTGSAIQADPSTALVAVRIRYRSS